MLRVVVEKVLPLSRVELQDTEPQLDYIFEQPPQEIFNRLLPRYVEVQIYRALLESAASEHGARMSAMANARGIAPSVGSSAAAVTGSMMT